AQDLLHHLSRQLLRLAFEIPSGLLRLFGQLATRALDALARFFSNGPQQVLPPLQRFPSSRLDELIPLSSRALHRFLVLRSLARALGRRWLQPAYSWLEEEWYGHL
ncbi:MAG: hypothetical protein K6U88_15845, partial [Dehalococcoidia bacterium]|nr:hypothetical protein [Dehalococcoidia bacterium]